MMNSFDYEITGSEGARAIESAWPTILNVMAARLADFDAAKCYRAYLAAQSGEGEEGEQDAVLAKQWAAAEAAAYAEAFAGWHRQPDNLTIKAL